MALDVNMIDVKKTQEISKPVNANTKEATVKASEWQNFLGDLKDEFRKISWTHPEELMTYTKVVVIGTFCFGMGIYAMDLLIQALLSGLGVLARFIGG